MPLVRTPYDFEFINHAESSTGMVPSMDPEGHPDDTDDQCRVRNQDQDNNGRWVCTRKEGHLGRHEAGHSGMAHVIASWADKPGERAQRE